MSLTEIFGPVLLVILAIVAVAVFYFIVTSVKDRMREKHEQRLAEEARRNRPRRHPQR